MYNINLVAEGQVVKIKSEENAPTLIIVKGSEGKKFPVYIPQDHYQKLIDKNGSFMMKEVQIFKNNQGFQIKIIED